MSRRWYHALPFVLLLLTGCKTEVDSDIFVNDMTEVANGKDNVTTDLTIRVEVPSEKQCAELKQNLVDILSRYKVDVRNYGCSAQGMNSFASFTTTVPVLHLLENDFDKNKSLIALDAVMIKERNLTTVYMLFNMTEFERLKRDIAQINPILSFDLKDLTIVATVNNDQSTPARLSLLAAFLNGAPAIATKTDISRHQKAEIRLSDVGSQFLVKNGYTPLFQAEPGT